MTQHSSKNQVKRVVNGKEAEQLIADTLNEHISTKEFYDLETPEAVIEIKSCEALVKAVNNRKRKYIHFGRFNVCTRNHISLIDYAKRWKKIPLYIFVLNIKDNKIIKTINAKDLKIDAGLKSNSISWKEIFYPELITDCRY